MTLPKSQLAFQLKTLFMGSDGTIPESYARTVDRNSRLIIRGMQDSQPKPESVQKDRRGLAADVDVQPIALSISAD